jgi:hypothetical protein
MSERIRISFPSKYAFKKGKEALKPKIASSEELTMIVDEIPTEIESFIAEIGGKIELVDLSEMSVALDDETEPRYASAANLVPAAPTTE